jgi:Eukaryotic aspartyl protease
VDNSLVIDSGSGVLWVADKDCRGCNVSTAHLYDGSASSTSTNLNQPFQLLYQSGNWSLKPF